MTCPVYGERVNHQTREHRPMQHGPVDVAIVTALVVEREAVLKHLDTLTPIQDDAKPLTYYRGQVTIPTQTQPFP